MGELETALVAEPHRSQRIPVVWSDRGWVEAQLLRDRAQCPHPLRLIGLTPVTALDRTCRLVIAALGTQKLCVRRRSVKAVLDRCRHGRHELALLTAERAGLEHDLRKQSKKYGTNPGVCHQEAAHAGRRAEVVRVVGG